MTTLGSNFKKMSMDILDHWSASQNYYLVNACLSRTSSARFSNQHLAHASSVISMWYILDTRLHAGCERRAESKAAAPLECSSQCTHPTRDDQVSHGMIDIMSCAVK